MKDNNKRMNNQGRNNNTHNNRNVTFVEELGSIVRRNSTVPQAVSGEIHITNGDVEGGIAVYCSNAAYRDKLLKEAEPETSKAIGIKEAVATKSATQQDEKVQAKTALKEQDVHSTDTEQQGKVAEAENELKSLEKKHEATSYTEKVADNYYNKVCELSRTIADAKDEDILVNVLVGCQLTRKFNSLNYSIRSDFSFIDERAVSKRLDFILTSFGIDTQLAQDVYNRIHDCLGFDVFTIKAKNNNVYIICGNVDGVVETFCSATASETSMQFITRMMEANKP